MNVPNSLSLLRIALIPCYVAMFYLPGTWTNIAAASVFGLAALTDWLDGYMARRLQQSSKLGAFLDPVADKLLIAVVLILLLQRNPEAWLALPIAVIIGREITISALREWMAELGARHRVAVSMVGKVKTTCQMIAIILLTIRDPLWGIPIYQLGAVALYLATAATLWSMYLYLKAAWPELKRH
ncbi:MAG: CDP-diacylglycerol--glycerol-3-phosphate 3-phosphatidyltransferase [Gammaproteobacteria bacterium]|nr:CDP-diacylglycerol--glycerol-3-phosphate 3-phosphatidyltransferase [Gammaproteobacteria bacterium]